MAGLPRYPRSRDDAGTETGGSTTGAPRWVKVLGIIALLLILLVVVLLIGGNHGPGRHMS